MLIGILYLNIAAILIGHTLACLIGHCTFESSIHEFGDKRRIRFQIAMTAFLYRTYWSGNNVIIAFFSLPFSLLDRCHHTV